MDSCETHFPMLEMVSEHSCLITFADVISPTTADKISIVTHALGGLPGIVDLIPSYTTLLLILDTDHYESTAICSQVRRLMAQQEEVATVPVNATHKVVIPVYYGAEVGPDLEQVARHCHLTAEAVIALHSQTDYRAYAMGFMPGFAFLGNTPEALHMPRKVTPRLAVPAGSVAIAEQQSAVYPSATPGGWQIIGRTPLSLIDWNSDSLALIKVGDSVRFEAISRAQFLAQGGSLDGF